MTPLSEQLENASRFHLLPHLNFSRATALSNFLTDFLAYHASQWVQDRPLSQYRILALSQPREDALTSVLEAFPKKMDPHLRRYVATVRVDHPSLMDTRRLDPADYHALVVSTFLEHEKNPQKSLEKLHGTLRPNGVALMVFHHAESPLGQEIQSNAGVLADVFRVLSRFAEGKLDAQLAAEEIKQYALPSVWSIPRIDRWLARFKRDSQAQRVVETALTEARFDAAKTVGSRIVSRGIDEAGAKRMAERAGFDPARIYATSTRLGNSVFVLLAAAKDA